MNWLILAALGIGLAFGGYKMPGDTGLPIQFVGTLMGLVGLIKGLTCQKSEKE